MSRTATLSSLLPAGLLLSGIQVLTASVQDEPPAPQEPPAERPDPPGFLSEPEWDPSTPRGVLTNEPEAAPGLTLVQPINSRFAHLIELDGTVAHTWEFDSAPGEWSYLLDDGTLLRAGREDDDPHFRGGGIGGRLQRVAPDGTLLWNYRIADTERHAHHDIEPLPNGNLLTIVWERISDERAIELGRSPDHVGSAGLWVDSVLELKPVGDSDVEVVWEWHALDHLVQDLNPEAEGFGDVKGNHGRIDVNGDHRQLAPQTAAEREQEQAERAQLEALGYAPGISGPEPRTEEELAELKQALARSGDMLHTNGIDYDAEHDLIALSVPEMNEIWILDHSTTSAQARGSSGGRYGHGGDLLWRWGNPGKYGLGGPEERVLGYQHDPKFLRGPAGELRLTLFNNRAGDDGDLRWSEVLELELPFRGAEGFIRSEGEPFGPAAPVWTYSDPGAFFSSFISGAERLPNGNTIICSGAGGRLFEVTPDGRTVWNFRNTFGGDVDPPDHAGKAPKFAVFRAARYPADHPGVRALLVADEPR